MADVGRYCGIYAISDLHVDTKENLAFVESWSDDLYKNAAVIVAGDVTDNVHLLQSTLAGIKKKFKDVFYVPGNHELWIRNGNDTDSISKFHSILRMCLDLGVHTDPAKLSIEDSCDENPCVWIVPIFSWYAKPEEDCSDSLYEEAAKHFKENVKFSEQVWMDNHLCIWTTLSEGMTASKYFSGLNKERVGRIYDSPVISFSHFVPRLDLVRQDPTDISEVNAYRSRNHLEEAPSFQGGVRGFNFSRYAGSQSLEKDIRCVKSVLHVYGHQHRNRDRVIDKVRYVSHCLGYVREQKEGWTWGIDEWKGPKKIWP